MFFKRMGVLPKRPRALMIKYIHYLYSNSDSESFCFRGEASNYMPMRAH